MKNRTLLSLLVVVAGCGAALTSTPASPSGSSPDWPQWRGPDRNAVSTQTGLIQEWPEAGPSVLWRIRVGEGFSSVSVADGRLYTLWDENDRQFLVSLDAATGKEVWRHTLGAGFTNPYGDGPRSTPLVSDGVVFAIGTQGLLVATDASTGKVRWQHDLVGEFSSDLPSYGYASSPLVVDERLMVEVGGKNAAFVAFHKDTGKVVWQAGKDKPAYSSPIAVSLGGVQQVVFWSAHGLHSVAASDGTSLWDYTWETFCPVSGAPLNTGTPIFMAPDRLFVSSGSGAASLRVSRTGDTFEVKPVWKSAEMRSDVNSAVVVGNHIYGFDRGILKSLDARTGELQWKARGFQKGSLIAADGQLIVLGETGNLALVDANPQEFVQKSNAQVMSGRNWTAPSLAAGRLYVRNHEELICLDMEG